MTDTLAMQLDVRVVGVDLKIVVQGRELVSLQLLDAIMAIDMAPDPPPTLKGHSLRLELRIVDISVRDLQVPPPPPASQPARHTFPEWIKIAWATSLRLEGSGRCRFE